MKARTGRNVTGRTGKAVYNGKTEKDRQNRTQTGQDHQDSFPVSLTLCSSPLSFPFCLFPYVSLLCLFPYVCSPLSLQHTELYIPLKTFAFPPAERLWALKPDFHFGLRKKHEFALFFCCARRFRFFSRPFFFALFFSLRACERGSVKKAPAPTSAYYGTCGPIYNIITVSMCQPPPSPSLISTFLCPLSNNKCFVIHIFLVLL